MDYLDTIGDLGTRRHMIETLRDITEGKIYVEVERARLTIMLAKIILADGDVKGAADVIQEVQIETVGSMDRREKFEFILQQMQMCLEAKEYLKAHLVSKKVGFRAIREEQFEVGTPFLPVQVPKGHWGFLFFFLCEGLMLG